MPRAPGPANVTDVWVKKPGTEMTNFRDPLSTSQKAGAEEMLLPKETPETGWVQTQKGHRQRPLSSPMG